MSPVADERRGSPRARLCSSERVSLRRAALEPERGDCAVPVTLVAHPADPGAAP